MSDPAPAPAPESAPERTFIMTVWSGRQVRLLPLQSLRQSGGPRLGLP